MTTADFRPTHVVPQDGLPAWEAPDATRPTTPLDALLPVCLVDRIGDWGRVVCANGWSAWVDGRLLVAVPQDPPAAGHPLTRTADPRPLLARSEDALTRYRRAAEELVSGTADGESFHRRTRGLRVGMIVDGESVWLYDAEHERWVYCDGTRLSTYAAGEGPSAHGDGGGGTAANGGQAGQAGAPEPTQVVEAVPDPGSGPVPGTADRPDGGNGTADPYGRSAAPAPYDQSRTPDPYGRSGTPDPYGEDPTRRIPPVTVDPDPPARPGDA
ncbi:hypothetical protein [Streptomyces alboflavus]|uniref:hypothetical protein n=1 Tax=Streptomyces alboflavus TaxID=67267 RepID=UPI000526F5B7|nr:hypothetical protein [Streptomyces alboflavus]